uniref:Uncharacterized protein n=1 Tax=Anguilla anguilla TaxID=7936 RepID=A0A0E9Q660_ANGAN
MFPISDFCTATSFWLTSCSCLTNYLQPIFSNLVRPGMGCFSIGVLPVLPHLSNLNIIRPSHRLPHLCKEFNNKLTSGHKVFKACALVDI